MMLLFPEAQQLENLDGRLISFASNPSYRSSKEKKTSVIENTPCTEGFLYLQEAPLYARVFITTNTKMSKS
jgi:hypothetical protein